MRFFKALIDGLLNGLAPIFSIVMFLLLLLLISFSFYFVFLTWCLRLHARVLRRPFCVDSGNSMCLSYWKNVRWSYHPAIKAPVAVCFSCYWKNVRLKLKLMLALTSHSGFSCCWKNVRLKRKIVWVSHGSSQVSVVVERMYDWSSETNWLNLNSRF